MNKLELREGNVIARCPGCGAQSSFETTFGGKRLGRVVKDLKREFRGSVATGPTSVVYQLHRCATCGRGGMSEVICQGTTRTDEPAVDSGRLAAFWPIAVDRTSLPPSTPTNIESEFREAERCAAIGANRAAAALFRSVLEKTLVANGYSDKSTSTSFDKMKLRQKIDEASRDGVITQSRRAQAHAYIRELGNDVVHQEWFQVRVEQVERAQHLAQRIVEDFYADRRSALAALRDAKRCPKTKSRRKKAARKQP